MTELKFRAWHIERKIMLVVYGIEFSDEGDEPLSFENVWVRLDGEWAWLERDEYILEQYAGRQDDGFDRYKIVAGNTVNRLCAPGYAGFRMSEGTNLATDRWGQAGPDCPSGPGGARQLFS